MPQARAAGVRVPAMQRTDGLRVLQGKREYVTYPDNSSVRIWYSDTQIGRASWRERV